MTFERIKTMNGLTVSALARAAGVTPKTIRYYEHRSLLPDPPRDENGYRRYSTVDLNRLRFIGRAKTLGLTLSEIEPLLRAADYGACDRTQAELETILDQKIADCSQRIDELQTLRRNLVDARSQLHHRSHSETGEETCNGCAEFDPACDCIPETASSSLDIAP